jgi:hypothetical protein
VSRRVSVVGQMVTPITDQATKSCRCLRWGSCPYAYVYMDLVYFQNIL